MPLILMLIPEMEGKDIFILKLQFIFKYTQSIPFLQKFKENHILKCNFVRCLANRYILYHFCIVFSTE